MVTLNSFIVSNTRLPEVGWWDSGMTKDQFEKRHVLFQKEDKDALRFVSVLTEADRKKEPEKDAVPAEEPAKPETKKGK